MIRVLVKSSSSAMKAGWERLLRSYPQFQIIDEASADLDGQTAFAADSEPDVVLADSVESGDAAGVPLILLVLDPSAESEAAFRQGARAVLSVDASARQTAAAIEAVLAGLLVIDSDHMDELASPRDNDEASERLPEALTPREVEILRTIAEGLANKEIAARLGISENTVKFHVASIMGKLGANSRTEAVMIGIRHGIVLI